MYWSPYGLLCRRKEALNSMGKSRLTEREMQCVAVLSSRDIASCRLDNLTKVFDLVDGTR
jgi:hypothetical protein